MRMMKGYDAKLLDDRGMVGGEEVGVEMMVWMQEIMVLEMPMEEMMMGEMMIEEMAK